MNVYSINVLYFDIDNRLLSIDLIKIFFPSEKLFVFRKDRLLASK